MRSAPLYAMVLLVIAACTASPPGSPAGEEARQHVVDASQAADTVHLSLGETVRIHPADLILRFEEVVGDSRCRPDVQCVWEGSVRVLLMVALAAGGASDAMLESSGAAGGTSSTTAGVYRITLLRDITPPPGQAGRYRIALELRRL